MSERSLVAAQVYGWQSGDSIAGSGTADAGDPYALASIIDPNQGPHMARSGRTTTAGDAEGFTFGLTATIDLCAMELLNTGSAVGEKVSWEIDDALTFAAPDVIATPAWGQHPVDIWAGYTAPLQRSRPVRSNLIVGQDNLATGPAPANPPEVATVTCGSGRILFTSAGAGRTFWEASFLALGINGYSFRGTDQKIGVEPINLRSPSTGGTGYKYTLEWKLLDQEDGVYLDGLWEASARGNYPVFLFPQPGQRASGTGEIPGVDVAPHLRGGLMRLKSWKRKGGLNTSDGRQDAGATLVAETWQEVTT